MLLYEYILSQKRRIRLWIITTREYTRVAVRKLRIQDEQMLPYTSFENQIHTKILIKHEKKRSGSHCPS